MKPSPPKKDGDWVTVIFYNEGQVTELEKSTVVHLVKAMVFPVDMYGCESWTVKNAEC